MDINQEARVDRCVVTMGGIVAECATPQDAIRIAACINACRGVSNYALSVDVKSTSQIALAVEAALVKIDDARAVLGRLPDSGGCGPTAGQRWVRVDDGTIEVLIERVASGTVFYSFPDYGMRAMPAAQFAGLYYRINN